MKRYCVVLKGHITVNMECLEQVKLQLETHIQLTKQEPGCLQFEVYQDDFQSNRFNVYEVFIDDDAFLYHQQRVKTSRWGELTINAERHYHISRLEMDADIFVLSSNSSTNNSR